MATIWGMAGILFSWVEAWNDAVEKAVVVDTRVDGLASSDHHFFRNLQFATRAGIPFKLSLPRLATAWLFRTTTTDGKIDSAAFILRGATTIDGCSMVMIGSATISLANFVVVVVGMEMAVVGGDDTIVMASARVGAAAAIASSPRTEATASLGSRDSEVTTVVTVLVMAA
ncbi:unnamed protein product [Linum trigynum]|uniref:Uncharacterized protein n=1 Tax=Linum trigynum TaxID=586398 RepID=A0AAV2DH64_9ROSI